jgi:GNAT superfamily N-acetyltransferase
VDERSVATPVVRRFHDDDLAPAVALLVRAFDHDPLNRVLFPDPGDRQRLLEVLFRTRLRVASVEGEVLVALEHGQLSAVAVWFPPGTTGDGVLPPVDETARLIRALPSLARVLPAAARLLVTERSAVRAYRLQRRHAVAALRREPSWHLAGLAVEPTRQGRGLARRLLELRLTSADRDGVPVWLETNYPTNVPLYERFGFHVVEHDASSEVLPAWWLMVREPRREDEPARGCVP